MIFICNYFLKKTISKSLLLNLIYVNTLLYNDYMKDIFKEYHDPRCEVCFADPCELDCPKDYLENDTEQLNTIVGLFEDYVPDEEFAQENNLGMWKGTFIQPKKWRKLNK